jgi:hypothetical protein
LAVFSFWLLAFLPRIQILLSVSHHDLNWGAMHLMSGDSACFVGEGSNLPRSRFHHQPLLLRALLPCPAHPLFSAFLSFLAQPFLMELIHQHFFQSDLPFALEKFDGAPAC